jgi:hypothetical protein
MSTTPGRAEADVRQCYEQLVFGFREPVEFVRVVNGQREVHRVERRYEGLIGQLMMQSTVPLPSRTGDGPGGGKPGSRPPLNMVYRNAVDTIQEQAYVLWEMMEPESPPTEPLTCLLADLRTAAITYADERPKDVQTLARGFRKWVTSARVLLGYESRKVTLADTVCGQCGGTLAVAVDATSDVRCIGTADADPCGMIYGRLEWVSLLGGS